MTETARAETEDQSRSPSAVTMNNILSVFKDPEQATKLSKLDWLARIGKLQEDHVITIYEKFIENAKGKLWNYTIRFCVFVFNVVKRNNQHLKINQIADICNMFYELEKTKYLECTELPKLRRKLREIFNKHEEYLERMGISCYIDLDEDYNVVY